MLSPVGWRAPDQGCHLFTLVKGAILAPQGGRLAGHSLSPLGVPIVPFSFSSVGMRSVIARTMIGTRSVVG